MDEIMFDDIKLGADIDGEDLDDIDLTNFGEVNTDVDEPHIRVSTKSFLTLLKLAKQVSSTSGRDIITKSILFSVDGDNVVVKATDLDTYFEYKMECLNTENVLKDSFSVPLDILVKVAKALPANTIFLKRGETIYIRIFGGDLPLEVYNVDKSKYEYTEPIVKVNTISATELYSTIKDLSPLVTAAINPTEKRIVFESHEACCSYMWAIISAGGSWGNFDLRVKDINLLRAALVDLDEDVTLYTTDETVAVKRAIIKGSKFMYAFYVSENKVPVALKTMLAEINGYSGSFVDLVQLYKLVEVASELPYSIGKVGLTLTDEGVRVAIKTKRNEDSIFNLTGSYNSGKETYKQEIVVQAKLLRILLRTFASESAVQLVFSDKGLGVFTDSYKAALFLEE
jgi:hypothetical protein